MKLSQTALVVLPPLPSKNAANYILTFCTSACVNGRMYVAFCPGEVVLHSKQREMMLVSMVLSDIIKEKLWCVRTEDTCDLNPV